MDPIHSLPDARIQASGVISEVFHTLGVGTFHDACRYVQAMAYGYNSNRDDLLVLFNEKRGNCTTKHAVIATLASELGLPVGKHVGIYPMTEALVTGTGSICKKYALPYVPMVHCFLAFDRFRVDLTENNRNGKNKGIDEFLHTEAVDPAISGKEEYLLYRRVMTTKVLMRKEFFGIKLRTVLHAREEGLILLKERIRL